MNTEAPTYRFERNYAPDPSKLEAKAPQKRKKTDEELAAEEKKQPVKTLCVFVISNFGILFIVLIYVCAGALLFQILEQHLEMQTCQLADGEWNNLRISHRSLLFNYIYFNTTADVWLPQDNTSQPTTKDGPSAFNPRITSMLTNFTNQIRKLMSSYKYTGQNCDTQSYWQYMSAVLFTFTIVSTIGYGHVTVIGKKNFFLVSFLCLIIFSELTWTRVL